MKELYGDTFEVFYKKITDWFAEPHELKIKPHASTIKKLEPRFRLAYKTLKRPASDFIQAGEAILEERWFNGTFKISLLFMVQRNFLESHIDKKPTAPKNIIKEKYDSGEQIPVDPNFFKNLGKG